MKESNDGNKAPKKSFLYYYGLVKMCIRDRSGTIMIVMTNW